MNRLINHNFKDGPLDNFIGTLIGKSREAKEEWVLRSNVLVVLGEKYTSRNNLCTDEGFFWMDKKKRYRIFLYLKRSRVKSFQQPKRHYFFCEKVRENLPYVVSNQDLVDVRCSETNVKHSKVQLEVCRYCRSIFNERTTLSLTGNSFEEFILGMEDSELTRTRTTGKDGYITNWQEISTAYRKTQNYICETCKLRIEKIKDQHFMHTHHINHKKSDNRRDNLKCLCIRCHSEVNQLHRKNFSEPHQQRWLKKFNILYPR